MDSRRTVGLIILLVLVLAGFVFFAAIPKLVPQDMNDNSAATQTVPVATTTPTEPAPLSMRVSVDSPKKGATVPSKFAITGKAPGNWYFEAVFPIVITGTDGAEIARTQGRASPPAGGDWMTTELVPFSATIDAGSYRGLATVNLLRDNPSGLPENEDSVSFEVTIR